VSQSSSGGADDSPAGAQQGPSLLDFVAKAMFDAEVRNGEPDGQLRNAIEVLRNHLRAASSVALEEIMAAVPLKIAEAQSVAQGLGDLEHTPGQQRAEHKVKQICEEANLALKLSDGAKKEFERLQKWSCTKQPQKSESWFRLWNQFLEQLMQAISRAYETKRAEEKSRQQNVNAGGTPPRPALKEICPNSRQGPGDVSKAQLKLHSTSAIAVS
jgi:hypothetical protein